jgi:hypothetical protein
VFEGVLGGGVFGADLGLFEGWIGL